MYVEPMSLTHANRLTLFALCVSQTGCTPSPEEGDQVLCNGDQALCTRPLSDVTFPATHNANATEEYGYSPLTANQTHGIQQQLEDGVRAFMLDVMYHEGETALCHGICELGITDHVDTLGEFRTFLDSHPDEVLVFLYQDSISMDDLEQDLTESGLFPMVYTWDQSTPWPTLQELIDDDQRLIITTEHGTPPPAWVHHLWDVAWDTPYSFDTAEDFSCAANRGSTDNALFLMNHWLSGELGLPSQEEAVIANAYDVLHARALQCWSEAGQRPNFIAVDWYEEGDLIAVVQDINARLEP